MMAFAGRALGEAAIPGRFGPARRFSWDDLVAQAQMRARRPYARQIAVHAVPDFDTHVRLSYDPAEMVAGRLRLFPAKVDTAPDAVNIHVVENGMARAIVDTHGLFGGGQSADVAGFRVMEAHGGGDWLASLGASYFRAVGPTGQYGLSARAIAVDTAMPGPEEFPAFTDFWIEQKGPDHLLIQALVDGPSLCGAYAFDITRTGAGVEHGVRAALFIRRDIRRLGVAPITSMFDFDQATRPADGDWRPEVHDSDGLAIHAGNGERVWRPLDNPPGPRVHMLRADGVKGFGMIQRDTAFDHYQDDLNFYNRRPSLWVEPEGDWGPGAVMLYEMNTISENVDNMAAMWVSDRPARAGDRRDFAYRLRWGQGDLAGDGNAVCVNFFMGPGGVPGADPIAGAMRYVFDFSGPALRGLTRDSKVEAVTDLGAALIMANVFPVEGQQDLWRVTMDVRVEGLKQNEFRLFLRRAGGALSETVIKTVRP
ncbi:glucans biosynthesis protein [Novosphingobium sp. SG751A]|uniref:glucan biosynthesis protein n=1 Tax=Novosphingobium sp. SG751A TaxID=2587000 RepID=UPI0020A66474|nr:glucan biosynthesis protein [Novosphingobium sp. SG751A]NOW47882.1 glucans biosynthesis protein [Novosphingobium sp. SG751A]